MRTWSALPPARRLAPIRRRSYIRFGIPIDAQAAVEYVYLLRGRSGETAMSQQILEYNDVYVTRFAGGSAAGVSPPQACYQVDSPREFNVVATGRYIILTGPEALAVSIAILKDALANPDNSKVVQAYMKGEANFRLLHLLSEAICQFKRETS
jgi:hypothetical protein